MASAEQLVEFSRVYGRMGGGAPQLDTRVRSLKNTLFYPITMLDSDFLPRNVLYIPVEKFLIRRACPPKLAELRLGVKPSQAFFKGLSVLNGSVARRPQCSKLNSRLRLNWMKCQEN